MLILRIELINLLMAWLDKRKKRIASKIYKELTKNICRSGLRVETDGSGKYTIKDIRADDFYRLYSHLGNAIQYETTDTFIFTLHALMKDTFF